MICVILLTAFSTACFAENGTYLLLGDSIAVGTGTLNPSIQCYGWLVSKEKEYNADNRAVNGYTSDDLLEYIGKPEIISAVESADIISISIGGNDFLHNQPLAILAKAKLTGSYSQVESIVDSFEKNYRKIIDTILEHNPDALVILQTLYNPFYNEYRETCEKALKIYNDRVTDVAFDYGGNVILADVYSAFDGHSEYIADDSIHPNEAGHRAIASIVGECIDDYNDGGQKIDFRNIGKDRSSVLKIVVAFTVLAAAFAAFMFYRKK